MYISGFMLDAGRPQRLKERKLRRIKAKKPFPFFKLPIEIRNTVYEKVFSTTLNDKTVTPDPSYARRRYNQGLECGNNLVGRTINNGLALLQSCQQAHEEAAAVLYGRNTFYFDDSTHQAPSFSWGTVGAYQTEVEVSAHCEYCCRYARTHEYVDRCYTSFGRKHFISLPYTDLMDMQSWLSTIGERNRLRIRHIQIHFEGPRSVMVQPAIHRSWSHRPGKPDPVGGDILAEALRFLAMSHNLDTFGISFGFQFDEDPMLMRALRDRPKKAFAHLFSTVYHPRSRQMKDSLSSINGIRKLECEDIFSGDEHNSSEVKIIQRDFRKVKEAMEYGYGKHLKLESRVHWSKAYVDQFESIMRPKPKDGKKRGLPPL